MRNEKWSPSKARKGCGRSCLLVYPFLISSFSFALLSCGGKSSSSTRIETAGEEEADAISQLEAIQANDSILVSIREEHGDSVTYSDFHVTTYKSCKYSYQELCSIMDIIDRKYADLPDRLKASLKCWYVDETNNRITVIICGDFEHAKKDFKAIVCDSPCIEFQEIDSWDYEDY